MTIHRRIYIFMAAFIFLTVTTVIAQDKPAVIAYYSGDVNDMHRFNTEQLTHIIYCFGHLRGNDLYISKGGEQIVRALVGLKKNNPDLKVLLSLGGWGGCATCSDVFSTKEGRRDFAHSVKNTIFRLGADGIDLDWEYPAVQGPPGHEYKPEDKPNFTLLVKALRDSLPNGIITFAAGGYQDYLDSAIAWKEVMQVVDFVNLMTYDLVNGYSTVTGHHTPLYATHPEMQSIDRAVNFLLDHSVPANKIVIGAAFYGRVWENVDNENHGLYQNGKFLKSMGYRHIPGLFSSGAYEKYWDEEAKAPYGYSPSQRRFITFDDKQSLRYKVDYLLDKGLKGIMFWQLTLDEYEDGLLQAIHEAIKDSTSIGN